MTSPESAAPVQSEVRTRMADIFADIDSFDPEKFVAHLTDDVQFRFANNPPAVGREEVREAVAGFFGTIAGLDHHVREAWRVDDTVIVQADVTYTRLDGKEVNLPNADILTFRGDQVCDWRIYIDLAPVYA
ncbi:nuclear transport factor 2 family protein [Streptomyces sp. NPDC054784]